MVVSNVWYGPIISLKTSWLDEMLDSLSFMFSGMFLSNNAGWFLWLCTLRSALLGFMYGL